MNKKIKKELLQWIAILGVFLFLFITGLHTEVFGFLQRGIIATGIMNPTIEKNILKEYPPADLSMELLNYEGKKVSLAQYEGKVIFINIWATWCAPCIAEMPGINDLYNDLKNENIQFVLFSVDDEFENALAFIKRKEYSFPIYHSGGNIPPLYQTGTIPTTFIIDTKGNLVLEHQGMANYNSDEFKNFLRTLMGT